MAEGKSLAQWRFEIKTVGKRHWGVFFNEMLGSTLSNYPRFFKALNLYGDLNMFEAIVLTSNQEITGDPLGYVCKIAHSLWKEEQIEVDSNDMYEAQIKEAAAASKKKNDELAKKLKKLGAKSARSTI